MNYQYAQAWKKSVAKLLTGVATENDFNKLVVEFGAVADLPFQCAFAPRYVKYWPYNAGL